MKKSLLILMMVVLAIACVLTSCNKTEDATVESISVDTSTIKPEYEVNEIVDFSDIKVTVKYSDGSTETVGLDKLTIDEVDTSTAGTKQINVTYDGVSA